MTRRYLSSAANARFSISGETPEDAAKDETGCSNAAAAMPPVGLDTIICYAARRRRMRTWFVAALSFVFTIAMTAAYASIANAQDDSNPSTAAEPDIFTPPPDYAQPRSPFTMTIDLVSQHAVVYRDGIQVGDTPISSGKPGHETPTGTFRVLQKQRIHHSNRYDNAPMPYMQRLTWYGVALHAGHVPDYPASHGCIRMPLKFAKWLYSQPTMGMTVTITDDQPPEDTQDGTDTPTNTVVADSADDDSGASQ